MPTLLVQLQHIEDVLGWYYEFPDGGLHAVPHDLVADALQSAGLPQNSLQSLVAALSEIKDRQGQPVSASNLYGWINRKGVRDASISLLGKLPGFPAASTLRRRLSKAGLTVPSLRTQERKEERKKLRQQIRESKEAPVGEITVLLATEDDLRGMKLPKNVRLWNADDERDAAEQRKKKRDRLLAIRAKERTKLVAHLREHIHELESAKPVVLWITDEELGGLVLPANVRLATEEDLEGDWESSEVPALAAQLTPSWWCGEMSRRKRASF